GSADCDARSSPLEEPADITREEYRMNVSRNMSDSRRRQFGSSHSPLLLKTGPRSKFIPRYATAEPVVKVTELPMPQRVCLRSRMSPLMIPKADVAVYPSTGPIRRLFRHGHPQMITTSMHQRSNFEKELEATQSSAQMRSTQF
ncbi:hypothetical protein THAOC_18169, partial [Thalassiosira oceanica]